MVLLLQTYVNHFKKKTYVTDHCTVTGTRYNFKDGQYCWYLHDFFN